jgi:polysaccharide export outer membrane protein
MLRFAVMLGVVCAQGIVLARDSRADSAPASAAGGDYIIGPGDVLNVFVWRNPELSIPSLPVRPDGKISTPLVEDLVAVGKTTSQLAREMEQVLQKYVRSPQVNIIVVNALSAARQVVVVGAVVKPLALPYREGLTVLDAMLAVDGITEFAAGNRAKIVRQANGRRQEIRVKLTRLLSKGDLTQNLPLQPGDVLVVPEGFF